LLKPSEPEEDPFDSKERKSKANDLHVSFEAGGLFANVDDDDEEEEEEDKPPSRTPTLPSLEDAAANTEDEEEGDKELVVNPTGESNLKNFLELKKTPQEDDGAETVWDKYQQKRKEKRLLKKQQRIEQESQKQTELASKHNSKKKKETKGPVRINLIRDELQLLNLDLSKPSSFYNNKDQEPEETTNPKKKNNQPKEYDEDEYQHYNKKDKPTQGEDDTAFLRRKNIDLKDPRFQAMFNNPQKFEIDPTLRRVKNSATLQTISAVRQKRKTEQVEPPKETLSSTLSIIESIKRNAASLAKRQKF